METLFTERSTDPEISVIVPIYNVSGYLEQCLDSIICQSFENFQVIGVNDCSTDNSASVFMEYANTDERFALVEHDKNLGLPSARNTGIKSARGNYIFFLDSDDWISPHALKILYDLALSDDVDIAMGGVLKCEDASGAAFPANHANYMQKELHAETVFDAPWINWAVVSWNKLIRFDFIKEKNLIFSTVPRRFEDMLTYKWYLSGARISLTTDITYFYRQRAGDGPNGSIMQARDVSVLRDKLLAFADLCEFLIGKGHFNTQEDPLHGDSPTHLPRALSWILPEIAQHFAESRGSRQDNARQAFEAFKNLSGMLPVDYIENLPGNIPEACQAVLQKSLDDAVEDICRLFKKNNHLFIEP